MPPSTPHSQTRFLPGAMIASRYRVVALLGRGGMGEVYRADDTRLGEAVALKFLPERLENDASLRERFLGEARLARQVAHPNVCRVYDIGEVDGRLFLSMEYVDGEDLATLLRRIGRLPQEKAVQLARQMCAGLQAAHEQGIIHRDLKPSNIMIDGRGRARIADFGLAAVAESIAEGEASAGTPAYMAPEQMLGKEVTTRSDLYSLGLVLYELFTGRPAFDAHTFAEQLSAKQSQLPSSPSLHAPGIDPTIERVLLRCLQPDPLQRPARASDVALALPGGDPLAAAIAAGETPSPEMIAEAGGVERFPRAQSWGWLLAFVAGLVALFVLAPSHYRIQQMPIEKPPAVLLDRARDVSRALGWAESPRDEYSVLEYDDSQGKGLALRFGPDSVISHLRRFAGGTFRLLYRRSPNPLIPLNALSWAPTGQDPPLADPGMLTLELDGGGRLVYLVACPDAHDSSSAATMDADWPRLFALAGLDTAAFRRVAPQWTPHTYADRRAAWLGSVPGDPALPLRIEAASYRGRPVMFRSVYPWTPIPADAPAAASTAILGWLVWALFLGLLLLAGLRARQNLREGRADARGTLRMAMFAAMLYLAQIACASHFVNDSSWFAGRVLTGISRAALYFLVVSALYLTLEPVIRSTWPTVLVSWMRLIDGRFRDSRLGRDVLAGLTLAVGLQLAALLGTHAWAQWVGRLLPADQIDAPAIQTDALMGTAATVVVLLRALLAALQIALSGAAVMALFTVLTRRRGLSLFLSSILMVLIQGSGTHVMGFGGLFLVCIVALALLLMVRFGLVALTVFIATGAMLSNLPLAAPGSSWYWPTTAVGVVFLCALAAWGFRCMLASDAAPDRYAEIAGASRASSWNPRPRTSARTPAPAPTRPVTPSELQTEVSTYPSTPSELPTQVSPRPAGPSEGPGAP